MRAIAILVAALTVGTASAAPAARLTSDIVVTTADDLVNGDTSSVSALLANPGSDGVSLREAITATNNDPGTHTITFSPGLSGATIALSSQLPALLGGGVTINGDINGDGKPDITLTEAPGFRRDYCPSDAGCGFLIGSSNNKLEGLTLDGFGAGVDIEPWRPGYDSAASVPAGITLANDVVDHLVMRNVATIGVVLHSLFNPSCALTAGRTQPCQTSDTWSGTSITNNSIDSNGTGIEAQVYNGGDRVENTTITGNTVTGANNSAGIGLLIGNYDTGAAISGGVIDHNTISGPVAIGIDVSSGAQRANGNTTENVQVTNNQLNLVGDGSDFCCQGIVVEAGADASNAIFPNILPLAYPDGNTTQNITVKGNTITGTLVWGVSVQAGLAAGGSHNHVQNVQIVGNTITSSSPTNGVLIWTAGGGPPLGNRIVTDNHIANVAVTSNKITSGSGPGGSGGSQPPGPGAILLEGGWAQSQANSVSHIQIQRNVVRTTKAQGAIYLIGGTQPGASGDSVTCVKIAGNKVTGVKATTTVMANGKGASGNTAKLGGC